MLNKLLENFEKSLSFLGCDPIKMDHVKDEKMLFKFTDTQTDALWRCFYAFYRKGRVDALNDVFIFCINELK